MRIVKVLLVLPLFCLTLTLNAQDEVPPSYMPDKISFGLGGGLDFGGFGGNLLVYPNKNLGLFLGGGYALAGLGVNVGAKVRFISAKPNAKVNTYLLMMYGYNAAVAVSGNTDLSRLFYGPSAGIGFEMRPRPYRPGYLTIALLVPFRSSEVDDYMDHLENSHGVQFQNELFPIAFSLGYRFILK
jgi:hypothetical protein